MARAVVRKTFLSFEEDPEAALAQGAARRSKSIGCEPECFRHSEEVDPNLRQLNRVLNKDPASPGQPVAPLPGPGGKADVRELRQLHQRLREAALSKVNSGCSPRSACTMVPEDADPAFGMTRQPLCNVGSSNSISTMNSDWPRCELRNVGSSNSISSMGHESEESSPLAARRPSGRWSSYQEGRSSRQWRDQVWSSPPAPKDYCHSQVPKRCDLAKDYAKTVTQGPPTTMMIRNIPNHYTQCHMVRELEGLGFGSSYDFLYVPIDKGTMGSVGYCFVNFSTPEWAAYCQEVFNGRPFEKRRQDRRGKIAVVSVAHLQGLEANLRHYKNAAVTGSNQGNGPIIVASLSRALVT